MNQEVQSFASRLLEGDQGGAAAIVKEMNGTPSWKVFQGLITPALQRIGQLWEDNDITVADEHLATAVCDYVISSLFPWQGGNPDGKRAMLFCLEGEQHYLGLKMVSSLLVEKGWNVKFYGPDLPLEYAIDTAREWEPDLVGLSVTISYHLPQLQKYTESFSALLKKPDMLIGGRLAGKYDLSPYCMEGSLIIQDIGQLNEWLEREISKVQVNKDVLL